MIWHTMVVWRLVWRLSRKNCRVADCRASHHALPVSEITIFRLLALSPLDLRSVVFVIVVAQHEHHGLGCYSTAVMTHGLVPHESNMFGRISFANYCCSVATLQTCVWVPR